MASTKDIGVASRKVVLRQGKRIGEGSSISGRHSLHPPLERIARSKMRDGAGWRSSGQSLYATPPRRSSGRRFASPGRVDPPPPGEGEENHTDAVVTPPSTTMVWPVMKLEASEA